MRARFVRTRLFAAAVVGTLGIGVTGASMLSQTSVPAGATTASSVVTVPTFTKPLSIIGQVNLPALAAKAAGTTPAETPQGAAVSPTSGTYRSIDNSILAHVPHGTATGVPNPPTTPITDTNVSGETGFSAMGGVQQAGTKGGVDLEPPDQGLCAGGGYVMEFVNNALAIYNQSGAQLMAPVSSTSAFLQPTSAFMSDPRCYYDAPTQHWFYQEFVVGTLGAKGKVVTPSTQFLAVSTTADPIGTYTIYAFQTTDNAVAGCPCFGDYDELGADNNGIYITTDEFGIASGAYNGVIVYAVSKETLELAAGGNVPIPPLFGYRLKQDPFGQPYIVAPTSTPPGTNFAPNTEYFVESNSNMFSDNKLLVYALNNTSTLATPGVLTPPALYRTEVTAEPYAFPNDATQKAGPRPLGKAVQNPAGGIQADFNAEMEPTYVNGHIYAQLDTATTSGSNAVDWFIIAPTLSGTTLTATVPHEGAVAVKGTSLLYPYTVVNPAGVGYLLFSLSGPNNYPSPGYISYNIDGPTGSVMVATPGAAPEDGFTCYSAFVGPSYGGCRWGDYSMGAMMNGRVFMATEMVPSGFRDTYTNWGTYIWNAAPPAPAG